MAEAVALRGALGEAPHEPTPELSGSEPDAADGTKREESDCGDGYNSPERSPHSELPATTLVSSAGRNIIVEPGQPAEPSTSRMGERTGNSVSSDRSAPVSPQARANADVDDEPGTLFVARPASLDTSEPYMSSNHGGGGNETDTSGSSGGSRAGTCEAMTSNTAAPDAGSPQLSPSSCNDAIGDDSTPVWGTRLYNDCFRRQVFLRYACRQVLQTRRLQLCGRAASPRYDAASSARKRVPFPACPTLTPLVHRP